jgi:glycosyltransferase involved in cell wall biosynthesis
MIVAHLTASTFFGGPERQMLGLAEALPPEDRTVFVSFAEGGRCREFLQAARRRGFEAHALGHDTPHLRAAARELTGLLGSVGADVVCCHGYKANLLGRVAARRCGVPAVAVARGWTGESLRVRVYEVLDRLHLRWMDRVVSVSEAQAAKVRRCGVKAARREVIHNAIDVERFADPDPVFRTKLERLFRPAPERLVGAAGRLSPEKGFDVLVAAAERVARADGSVGFVLFGDGACRARLEEQIHAAGLRGVFVLNGFRSDLDAFLPFFDLFVLPSYTEGLPNVVLESFAAGVPVVATAVGGTPEVVDDGVSGYLVPPGDADALAVRIREALASEVRLRDMGLHGRQRVVEQFSFDAQARRYRRLFRDLVGRSGKGDPVRRGDDPARGGVAEKPGSSQDLIVTGGPCEQ